MGDHDKTNEIMRSLGRIEGRLDELNNARFPERVRNLERNQYWFSGILASIGAAAGWALHKLGIDLTIT